MQTAISYARHVLLAKSGVRPTAAKSLFDDYLYDMDALLPDVDDDFLGPTLSQLKAIADCDLLKYVQCVTKLAKDTNGWLSL